ncbi:MAG TPA: pre-peptidase C-terminal domain-containing protein [Pirellulaceae bacterium]|nr:pre-peptidase C-terminal domain-containing protein [Pirellulaceae bacterium]HMO90755.1 pre-peptidase C-terminal domain-containing protein [Pirellulaceae bacterium]HMP68006.1 pre-peptidase C-terminal domain-containing protein [Pirellulaceae bacterium]
MPFVSLTLNPFEVNQSESLNTLNGAVAAVQEINHVGQFEATLLRSAVSAAASSQTSSSSQQPNTDRVFLPVSGKFFPYPGSEIPEGMSGVGTSQLTISAKYPNHITGLSGNSIVRFVPKPRVVYNETVTTIGFVDYKNGDGWHTVNMLKLDLYLGDDLAPLEIPIGISQGYYTDSFGAMDWPSFRIVDTPVGKAKIYFYSIFPQGAPTPPVASGGFPSSIEVEEGMMRRGELRLEFFGIDQDDQFSEAANLGIVYDEVSRSNWIAHSHDTDMYRFTALPGQRIAFDIDTPGRGLGDTFRAQMSLYNSSGQKLKGMAEFWTKAPDEAQGGYDPYFEYTFIEGGEYYVAINNKFHTFTPGNNHGGMFNGIDHLTGQYSFDPKSPGATGWYKLTLSDPDDQIVEATAIGPIAQASTTLAGELFTAKDVNMYSFEVTTKGQVLAFDLDYDRNFLGFKTFSGQARITLFGPNGNSLYFVNAFNNSTSRASNFAATILGESGQEPYLEYRFATPGIYHIAVSAKDNFAFNAINGRNDVNGGGKGRYSLTITNVARVTYIGDYGWGGTVSIPNKANVSTIYPQLYSVNGTKILPNRQTWIVIHGRNDYSTSFENLAKNLQNYLGSNRQVLLLNWSGGSHDNPLVDDFGNLISGALQGTAWVPNVAKWVESIMELHLNVIGHNLSLVGHSWGSYLAYEIAKRVQGQQKAVIALDPAKAGTFYNWQEVNFRSVSQLSWAFYGDGIYGNSALAQTAHEAFRTHWHFSSPDNEVKHAAPKQLFENLVSSHLDTNQSSHQFYTEYFNLSRLLSGTLSDFFTVDAFSGFEGIFQYNSPVTSSPYRFWFRNKKDAGKLEGPLVHG